MAIKTFFPLTNEFFYKEDVDDNVLMPTINEIEEKLLKSGLVLTDEQSDIIFNAVENLVYNLIPNVDYRNYN